MVVSALCSSEYALWYNRAVDEWLRKVAEVARGAAGWRRVANLAAWNSIVGLISVVSNKMTGRYKGVKLLLLVASTEPAPQWRETPL